MPASFRIPLLALIAAGLAALGSTPAAAHVTGHMTGLGQGLIHPLIGLDHLFAIVAVGVLAGLRTGPWMRALPVLFTLAFAVGAFMGLGAPESRIVEPAIAGSVVVLGIAIMRPGLLRAYALTGIVVCLALVHGYAHGSEAPASGAALFIAGMSATALALAFLASWFFHLPALKPRLWYFGATCSVAGLAMLVPSL
jgi:urease accessory protein